MLANRGVATERLTVVPADSSLLITDDDDTMRWTLREIFEPVGFQIYLASNGHETLEMLGEHAVDCLLIDLHMPGMTGLETIRQLALSNIPTSPISILLTADATPAVMQQALSLHVFTVIAKPFSKDTVTTTVERALKTRSKAS